MSKLRAFVSSVQKELTLERQAIAQLCAGDLFLDAHLEAVLFESLPTSGKPNPKAYLECLESCQIYVLILDLEYGNASDGNRSPTHEEYLHAQRLGLPTAVFVKGINGNADQHRHPRTQEFFAEVKEAGHKYRRFHDREDLRFEVRSAFHQILKQEFSIRSTPEEEEHGDHQIEVASSFETTLEPGVPLDSLSSEMMDGFVEKALPDAWQRIWDSSPAEALFARGLAVRQEAEQLLPIRAAVLLFHPRPADRFPHCEILADAYDDTKPSGRPKGQETINAPIITAIERSLEFIDKHTLHPRRVVGLNNLRLDEYPGTALREALVNALVHRNYDDATRKVVLRVFSDRIEISSPGYPLRPLTLAKLRKGTYRPCSRNPLICQIIALLDHMEQRGTGFARMHDAMLDHGLEPPRLSQADGYFVVTLPGPAGNYDRLQVPADARGPVTPAVEAQLNERQKKILVFAQVVGQVNRGWCVSQFNVANDTAGRDLKALVELGFLTPRGRGRGAHYVWNARKSTEK